MLDPKATDHGSKLTPPSKNPQGSKKSSPAIRTPHKTTMLAPVKPQLSHHRTTSSSWLQPPPISYSFSIIPPKYPIKPQIGAPPPTSNSSTIPTKNTAKHRIPDLYAYNPNFNPNHKYKTPKPQSSCHIPITDCKDHRSAPHRNTYPSTNPKSRFLLSTSRRHNHR